MAGKYTKETAIEKLREAGAEPLVPYPESMSKKWASKCLTCGAEIFPRLQGIDFGGKACRYCHGSVPIDQEKAVADMREKDVEPLEPYPGNTNKPWRVQCLNCGSESAPTYNNVKRGQGACSRCAHDYGDLPANVYLFHTLQHRAVKVGITNANAHRLTKYPGWKLVEVIATETGRKATEIEAEILRHWRIDLGLKPKLTQREMPQKGYTETADESGLIPALEILMSHKREN